MREYFNNIYSDNLNNFNDLIYNNLKDNIKTFIVTANPESYMVAFKDNKIDNILKNEKYLIVPDGIGVIKALKKYDINATKIPGVDIVKELFKMGNELEKTIYLFGAKKDVVENLNNILKEEYPNLKIIGYSNGYVKDKEKVFDEIVIKKPDIVMVALGIPNQEILIDKYYNKFEKGIFIGVGGSFDVLSGYKARAPKIFRNLNIEWLYRIITEPKRIKKFYKYNIKFLIKIKRR